jgi:hypothetical protein
LAVYVQNWIDDSSVASLVAKFGDWWDKWDAAGRKEAVEANHVITELTDAERKRWRETLQPTIDAYIEQTTEQGVENAREIYERMAELLAEKRQ